MSEPDIIAPLEWSLVEHIRRWDAKTPFGNFHVQKGSYQWCFQEYYDEHEGSCADDDEGKALCQAEWNKRILPCVKLACQIGGAVAG